MEIIQELLAISPQIALNMQDFLGSIISSFLASLVVYILYQVNYARTTLGSSVHRMFLLGGPSITALLVAIQFSLPLSLGLLGALSIVRFRTPVKDPAEIGYVLLLIASAIGCATLNYWLVVVLLGLATLIVVVTLLREGSLPMFGHGHLMVTVEGDSPDAVISEISKRVIEHSSGSRMQSISVLDGRCSIQYKIPNAGKLDWSALKNQLGKIAAPRTIILSARTSDHF